MTQNLVDLKRWKQTNEMRPTYICCDEFGQAERQEVIVATDKGWAILQVFDGFNVVAFDVYFCPFCGTKLPEVKE